MALPTSIQTGMRGRYSGAGITVEMYPSTVRGLSVELQYATANSTATSVWASVILSPSSVAALRHTIPVPESTRPWFMKARHPEQAGYSAGPFTPTINARAKVTPHIQRPILPQMTYQGNVEMPSGADVFVSSGRTVKVGTQVTTGTKTKTLLVPHAAAVDKNISTVRVRFQVATAHPSTFGAVAASLVASVVMPPGGVIKTVAVNSFRGTTSDVASFSFNRNNSSGGGTPLATLTHTTTGWDRIASSSLNESVTSTRFYTFDGSLRANAVTVSNAQLANFEIEYTMPAYDVTV